MPSSVTICDQPADGFLSITADHVFENHIVKDFLYWIYQRYLDDMDCGGLQGIFFRNGNDQNGVIDQIMEALSYWKEDDGRTYELFVLNQDLNAFKSMVIKSSHSLTKTQREPFTDHHQTILGR